MTDVARKIERLAEIGQKLEKSFSDVKIDGMKEDPVLIARGHKRPVTDRFRHRSRVIRARNIQGVIKRGIDGRDYLASPGNATPDHFRWVEFLQGSDEVLNFERA